MNYSVLLSRFGYVTGLSVFRLGLLVILELTGKYCRTLLVVSCTMLFLFRVLTCIGGEASGLGAPSLPTNASQRERQVL